MDSTDSEPAPGKAGSYTAFDGQRRLLDGAMADVVRCLYQATGRGAVGPLLIFDDRTGRVVDVDLRGTEEEVLSRLRRSRSRSSAGSPATGGWRPDARRESAPAVDAAEGTGRRRRGRPKLGVVGREVTLLPRHWEWLAARPGGASAALRKLIEDARRADADQARRREARDAAYRFMSAIAPAIAGGLPGLEEAAQALFADDGPRLRELLAGWPPDVRDHALALAGRGATGVGPAAGSDDAGW